MKIEITNKKTGKIFETEDFQKIEEVEKFLGSEKEKYDFTEIKESKKYDWDKLEKSKQEEYLDLHRNGVKPNIPLKEWAAYKPICLKINQQLGAKEKRTPEEVINPIKKEVVLPQIVENKKKKSIKIKF